MLQNSNDSCDHPSFTYDFENADYNGLNQFLLSVDWSTVLVSCQDVNIYWKSFVHVLNLGIDKFVPRRRTSVTNVKCPKSYPRFIQRLYKKKSAAWRAYKKFRTDCLRDKYERLEVECRTAINAYFLNIENRLLSDANIGKFYKYVNNKIVSRTGIGAIKNDQGDLLVDDDKKAESFDQFLALFLHVIMVAVQQ